VSKDKLIHIGTFGKTLGLKGEVKIIIHTSNVKSFFNYKPLLLEENFTELDLIFKRMSKGQAVVRINSYNTYDSVKNLYGKKIFVQRKKFPKIKKNEYYHVDLIDCEILSLDKKNLGKVKSIENYGAGDLINIDSKNNKEFYMPIDKENIVSIDLKKKIIIVNPMKGLVD